MSAALLQAGKLRGRLKQESRSPADHRYKSDRWFCAMCQVSYSSQIFLLRCIIASAHVP